MVTAVYMVVFRLSSSMAIADGRGTTNYGEHMGKIDDLSATKPTNRFIK